MPYSNGRTSLRPSGFKTNSLEIFEIPDDGPYIFDDLTLAHALGYRVKIMWWLLHTRNKHYKSFEIKKATGGVRKIHAPDPIMKNFQTHILNRLLEPLQDQLGEHVGAYRKGKSCRDTALLHVRDGAPATHIHMDIKNFFGSTRRAYVRRYFKQIGYNHYVASLLGTLLTVPDGKKNYVPQGNPTSGAITNLIADAWIDSKIMGALSELPGDWVYTRYADDMHISVGNDSGAVIQRSMIDNIIKYVDNVVTKAGYRINRKKTRVQRCHRQQKLLGVVVNDKGHMSREAYDRMKALIHNCFVYGFDTQHEWHDLPNKEAFITKINGKISYYMSIDPNRGGKLRERWNLVKARWLDKDENVVPTQIDLEEALG